VVTGVACGEPGSEPGAVGTPELRAALFDTILARTARREAFSPPKEAALAFDPLESMRALRSRVVEAETEAELFYALAAVSHARRDRHLDVALVPGGLQLPDSAGLDVVGGEGPEPMRAPIRVFPDYASEDPAYFVGDVAASGTDGPLPSIGDRILSVNGMPIAEWHAAATAYTRHSSVIGLRWKLGEAMTVNSASFPPELRGDPLVLGITDVEGEEHELELPWFDPATLEFGGVGEPFYPGTSIELSTPTYDLHVPDDPGSDYVVLVWRGFRETMVPDVDRLVDFARAEGLLDRILVMDVTRSRGGSLGPYAMQRLQPRAFKTTFGNLRVSDVVMPFIEGKRADFEDRNVNDGGVPEIIDDGSWLVEWLETDVMAALERGDDYTNDVPFKSAHAPRDSDGILEPAPVHFRGPLVVISGPSGGSHLDQFVSIVSDNGLGAVVGMPPGGYSNTWEWDEVLTFPGTDQPVLSFMWNIGHTIRPTSGSPSRRRT
jgi:hypothetical protein